MTRYLRLAGHYIRLAIQQAAAYRANFAISILHALLNLATGVLGVVVVFGQTESVRGWNFDSALAVLGVYLIAGAVRGLFIGPSLDALAGMGGEVWTGSFDYTLLRPVDLQIHVSVRRWEPLALLDLALGIGVLGAAISRMAEPVTASNILSFLVMLGAGLVILYAILLAFTAMIFKSPGFLFTWVFNALIQMARYPLGIYPEWLRLMLTWIVPVGVITTIPAEALTGALPLGTALGAILLAAILLAGASIFFRRAVSSYASASS
jgi:ABC-2 type transport system permease protein